jgi:hypothetical protein
MTRPEAAEKASAPRVGVFSTVQQAKQVIAELTAAGFTTEQITVICSDETRQAQFVEFEHQPPHVAPAAIATGSAVGAALGGLAAIAAGLATGGVALIFSGGAAAWAGAVAGGLVGGMMTRGVDRELADYYEQAVLKGKILVAAEDTGPQHTPHLVAAERIFAAHGALPVTLDHD